MVKTNEQTTTTFALVIKLRILSWGGYSGLSRWAKCNYKGSCTREAEGPDSEEEMTADAEGREERCLMMSCCSL